MHWTEGKSCRNTFSRCPASPASLSVAMSSEQKQPSAPSSHLSGHRTGQGLCAWPSPASQNLSQGLSKLVLGGLKEIIFFLWWQFCNRHDFYLLTVKSCTLWRRWSGTWNVAQAAQVKFCLILVHLNLNSCMWLMANTWDRTGVGEWV